MSSSSFSSMLCRDCLSSQDHIVSKIKTRTCSVCGSPRLLNHPELHQLSIAHIDCDAFFASIEKRDRPDLKDKPVIVGGGKRGVVAAACYVARIYGVRSAMPMFKALKLCPNAVVIPPSRGKYSEAGRIIRNLMRDVTPLVEPLSIDEAFLDLSGTEKLHKASPAQSLAKLVLKIEEETGLTASIGLSYNKFLAKIASDLDKPRGFSVIGEHDALTFLADKPPGIIYGVGKTLQTKLYNHGIENLEQIRHLDVRDLTARFGSIAPRLYQFAHGIDHRKVDPSSETKSVSSETTFSEDIKAFELLEDILWDMSESLADRLKASKLSGRVLHLKLKTSGFRSISRSQTLPGHTQLADKIFRTAKPMLERECGDTHFRLLGVGLSDLIEGENESFIDLGDPDAKKRADIEKAMDQIRNKMGSNAVKKGRSLK